MPKNFECGYPLDWPEYRMPTPRLQKQNHPQLSSTLNLEDAMKLLDEELEAFNQINKAVLCTNYMHLDDSSQRKRIGNETGVVLKLEITRQTYLLACDYWVLAAHNIYALHIALRHMRTITDWNVASLEMLLYSGQNNSSTASSTLPAWMRNLGLGPTASLADANCVYRSRAKEIAQDEDALANLNAAIAEARLHLT